MVDNISFNFKRPTKFLRYIYRYTVEFTVFELYWMQYGITQRPRNKTIWKVWLKTRYLKHIRLRLTMIIFQKVNLFMKVYFFS